MSFVEWRDGVHLRGTPLWCDAHRPRDLCVASHAFAAEELRHGQLIATPDTQALIGDDRERRPASQLAVPLARPFTLGELRIELFRSGHGLGAASLAVERAGARVVYAGAVNPAGGGLGGAADVRRGDALVIDATYGHPRYQFPRLEDAIDATRAFARAALAGGATTVLVVGSPLKALDVALRVGDLAPLRGHHAVHLAARRARSLGYELPAIKRWAGALKPGELVLWLADAELPADAVPSRRALVSGAALDPGRAAALGCEAGFAWSNRADYPALLGYIAACGARELYLTGRYGEALAAQLAAPGVAVTALGPPRQLSLPLE